MPLSFSFANSVIFSHVAWFRLFVGDLSNDVNDNTLNAAFAKYPSYCKCKVVRDRLSDKAKYGFIAFTDPEDFLKAWKEMDGKFPFVPPLAFIRNANLTLTYARQANTWVIVRSGL